MNNNLKNAHFFIRIIFIVSRIEYSTIFNQGGRKNFSTLTRRRFKFTGFWHILNFNSRRTLFSCKKRLKDSPKNYLKLRIMFLRLKIICSNYYKKSVLNKRVTRYHNINKIKYTIYTQIQGTESTNKNSL